MGAAEAAERADSSSNPAPGKGAPRVRAPEPAKPCRKTQGSHAATACGIDHCALYKSDFFRYTRDLDPFRARYRAPICDTNGFPS